MTTEIWKDIPGYEGKYQVSDQGRVRSLDRQVTYVHRWGQLAVRHVRGQDISIYNNEARGGYAYVNLRVDVGRQKMHRVCSLVLLAHVSPRPIGEEVRHLDGNPRNDSVDNLSWGTPKENAQDKVRHGTHLCGTRNPQCRLTQRDVELIRKAEKSELTNLAKSLGVHRGHLNSIRSGRRRSA